MSANLIINIAFLGVFLVVAFFIVKAIALQISKLQELFRLESTQNKNSLEEALSRSRMEGRQTMQMVIDDLQKRLSLLQTTTETRLEAIRQQVDTKLSETVSKNFESFGAVSKRLEELQAVTGQVVNLSQGVRDLSRILESPKLRGEMGEFQLGEMLRQVLPGDVFEEQFTIDLKRKEIVDAVIKLKEGYLCIDSKFPLNNARLILETDLNEEQIKEARKAFAQDVRTMTDSIATKYIIPEKTLDFALMFIPAESVFYELMKDMSLHQYCLKKHVIPVSPNSFYAYLQAIAVGFRGLKIQAEAKKIEATLVRLRGDFSRFQTDFSKVGRHLRDAQTQYTNVEDRVIRFHAVIDKLAIGLTEDTPSLEKTEIPEVDKTEASSLDA